MDRHANLQFIIGKASFTEQQLVENYFAALKEILRLKPAASHLIEFCIYLLSRKSLSESA